MLWATCSALWADFLVVSEHQSKEPFGNAQTIKFNQAITGKTPLTPEEEILLIEELPLSEVKRFYGRASINSSTLALDNIRNRSIGLDAPGTVFKRHATKSQIGLELAIGYSWERDFRGEIEYLVNKNFNFSASPILSTAPPRSLSVEIKNNTFLANVYYDFSGYDRFRPYLTGGLGASVNSVRSNLNPGVSFTNNWVNFAWQLGIGFRVSMFTRWFVDIKYRYIRLANQLRIKPHGDFRLNANYNMNSVSFGVIYLF